MRISREIVGNFSLGGIGTACFGSIIIYQLLHGRGAQAEEATVPADAQPEPAAQTKLGTGD
jgi:hypothetical protein